METFLGLADHRLLNSEIQPRCIPSRELHTYLYHNPAQFSTDNKLRFLLHNFIIIQEIKRRVRYCHSFGISIF